MYKNDEIAEKNAVCKVMYIKDQEEKHLQVNSEEFNQRHREMMELIERAGRKE